MSNTVQIPATFIESPPALSDRTVTYPLLGGGFVSVECPAWCADDHARDIEHGLASPADLQHEGAPISLSFDAVDGERETILAARLVQWPFDADGDSAPYIDLTPEASTAESLICRNRIELDEQIRKVRVHLNALIRLGDQLAVAQADDHAAHTQDAAEPWASLSRDDVQSMPIAYLLRVFRVQVVETEQIGRKAIVALYGQPGAMELRVLPDVPQMLREDQARHALLNWFDARNGGTK
ncbi:DUF6907 domain-containing protein [Streptomyces phaeoluteigriseus]|uniref:DUF6907 domain-containing protein n=1 Tax=Streptomyces phaeoluteigriseus TaxID=114686 RepID=UPI0036C3486F